MNFGKFNDDTKQLLWKFERFNKKFERILAAEMHIYIYMKIL